MKNTVKLLAIFILATSVGFAFTACSDNTDEVERQEEQNTDPIDNTDDKKDDVAEEENAIDTTIYDVSTLLNQYIKGDYLSYKIEGDFAIISSQAIPNHKSPYFKDTEWHDASYMDYDSNTFRLNPNRIGLQNYEFKIPLKPTKASTSTPTSMGPMGVSINGVPFYNQYAAGGAALDNEIGSFDQYNGHPDGRGRYHYHVEPIYLTDVHGEDAFLGFLLDGFPVYGAIENGERITSDDLDDFHGHSSATKDFPNGIYHYHITADDPYINGDGFYGSPGTVSN